MLRPHTSPDAELFRPLTSWGHIDLCVEPCHAYVQINFLIYLRCIVISDRECSVGQFFPLSRKTNICGNVIVIRKRIWVTRVKKQESHLTLSGARVISSLGTVRSGNWPDRHSVIVLLCYTTSSYYPLQLLWGFKNMFPHTLSLCLLNDLQLSC